MGSAQNILNKKRVLYRNITVTIWTRTDKKFHEISCGVVIWYAAGIAF
jgi:hypothetical protein